jgi:hypothetical protein
MHISYFEIQYFQMHIFFHHTSNFYAIQCHFEIIYEYTEIEYQNHLWIKIEC